MVIERYVNGPELADMMGISHSTIKRWRAAGMPSETWGMKRTVRYQPSRAMAWVKSRATISPTRDGDSTAPGHRHPKE